MALFGWAKPLNAGSTVMTSGSREIGRRRAAGPKSRGGVVTVLGGAAGSGRRLGQGDPGPDRGGG